MKCGSRFGEHRWLIAQAAWKIPQPRRFRGGGSLNYLNRKTSSSIQPLTYVLATLVLT